MSFGRLLVLSNDFPNSSGTYVGEVFVKEQVKCLRNYFEEIHVVAPIPFGIGYLRGTHYEDYRYENVHVHFPRYVNVPLFYFYGRNLWVYLARRAIRRLLEKEKLQFDLIHAHFTWPSGSVAVRLGSELRIPVVITEHSSVTFENAIRERDPQFLRAWELCDAIIRVRSRDTHLFESVGIPSGKIYCIPNGYDNAKFTLLSEQACRERLNLPLEKKIVLNVGNLYDSVKGHKYLIEAMEEVIKHREDVLCIIVGEGKLRTSLQRQIESLRLQEYVKLIGGRSHDEIPLWMNACDLFVLPSLREGLPVVNIEAMSCGKPVVATCNGGSEEVVTSEELGYLVEPGNSRELAERMLVALDKEWESDRIRKCAERFTWEDISREIVKVYEDILKNAPILEDI